MPPWFSQQHPRSSWLFKVALRWPVGTGSLDVFKLQEEVKIAALEMLEAITDDWLQMFVSESSDHEVGHNDANGPFCAFK